MAKYHVTEKRVFDWLTESLKESVLYQYYAQWCRNPTTNRMLPFDIFIPDLSVVIEIDGPQHFKTIKRQWGSAASIRSRDVLKMAKCQANGITVIRIPQEVVARKCMNWKGELMTYLSIIRFMRWDHYPIYIGATDEYDKHNKDLVKLLQNSTQKGN